MMPWNQRISGNAQVEEKNARANNQRSTSLLLKVPFIGWLALLGILFLLLMVLKIKKKIRRRKERLRKKTKWNHIRFKKSVLILEKHIGYVENK